MVHFGPAPPHDFEFGSYHCTVDGNQLTIVRSDGARPNPSWYETMMMKCSAFGAQATAVEVYPPTAQIVDGQNQKHLWRVSQESVPNLRTGQGVEREPEDVCKTTERHKGSQG